VARGRQPQAEVTAQIEAHDEPIMEHLTGAAFSEDWSSQRYFCLSLAIEKVESAHARI
jgi:hypothetical protein